MRFILRLLLGYCIRGKKPLLIATLTAVVCFIVLPTIALLQLAISVRSERLSRPPQNISPGGHRLEPTRQRKSSYAMRISTYVFLRTA
jgi:hypothetical protein